ncbi:MAG: helix-turn-helix domain-containing protein [Sulfurimonas sp.]
MCKWLRDFLLKNIWNDTESTNKKTVNVAIKRLKEKIDPLGEKNYIKTIRGIGYMIN